MLLGLQDFKNLFLSLEARKSSCGHANDKYKHTQWPRPRRKTPPPLTHTHASMYQRPYVVHLIIYYDPREIQWENRKTLREKCNNRQTKQQNKQPRDTPHRSPQREFSQSRIVCAVRRSIMRLFINEAVCCLFSVTLGIKNFKGLMLPSVC